MEEFGKFLNEAVVDGQEHSIAFAKKMVEDKEQVEVKFLKEQPVPMRMESEARCHHFHDVEVLAAYLKKYGTENTVVLADVGARKIECVLDESVKDGFEAVDMEPAYHPLFLPFSELPSQFIMKEFASFITRNRRIIVEPLGPDLAMTLSQIKVSKKITIHEGFGKRSLNGILCELNIAGEQKTEEIELPDEIKVQLPMFVGREDVTFTLDVMVECPRDNVIVTLSSPDIKDIQIREFESMLAELKEATEDGIVIGLGVVDTEERIYIGDDRKE